MDHHFRLGANGFDDELPDKYYKGRRPNGIYVPRFQNLDKIIQKRNYLRGFGYQGGGSVENWARMIKEADFGTAFKAAMAQPGRWVWV